jgi:hypothetical protein
MRLRAGWGRSLTDRHRRVIPRPWAVVPGFVETYVILTYRDPAFGNGVEGQRKAPEMRMCIRWDFRWGKKRIAGSIEIRF